MLVEVYDDANKWLDGILRKSTRLSYQSALRRYIDFTNKNPSELADEAIEDQKKDPRTRQNIVKRRVLGFHEWLTNEAPRRKVRGRFKPLR
ncbi:MAG: hypothetical protein WED05_05325 [Candidatus Atabeyarchaeum deiterrae]